MAVKVREQIASLTPAPKPATPTDPNFRRKTDPRLLGTSSIAPDVPLITSAPTVKAPAAPRASAGSVDNAPMPGGLKDLVSTQATPGGDYLRKMLGQDENALAAAKRALYDKEVGARDLSIFDKTAAELEARKQKLNAPKTGFDATMEYLEQIALGGGRSSFESGALGAARQRQLQLAREGKQNELMDKILELGAKKSEAEFAEKKGMFDLTQAEKDRIVKEKTEAAGKLNLSEDETRKLIEQGIQKELDRKANIRQAQISAQDRDNLMSRARALMAADKTLTLEQAMQRAAEIGAAGTMESAEVRNRKAYDDAVKDLNEDLRYLPIRLDKKNDPKLATLRAEYENKIKELKTRYKVAGQGLNALPTSTGLPAGVTVTQVR
jgi:hypothetical protein